ncbi:hypothetical protein SNOG_12819 [Parastagonospora nodorum SN15]|uniref:Uncharacterized protein n=1 Tax=Phaeosphaeria nodorum (strain SN15 / ATCC MYA-4574 / FGSC 10173) TaxID=321614 RepID=Q0U5Z5_PHANO|nr:hypothetical protein SNOG_12819 [Parastagonospora nodorum SN15]EAT79619.1 hypothetical protein SNOG_12819 [Parastagonospora nodorum SN15]
MANGDSSKRGFTHLLYWAASEHLCACSGCAETGVLLRSCMLMDSTEHHVAVCCEYTADGYMHQMPRNSPELGRIPEMSASISRTSINISTQLVDANSDNPQSGEVFYIVIEGVCSRSLITIR